MPRHNKGPHLIFHRQRQKYYIRWYVLGDRQMRSTGTSDKAKAEEVYQAFLSERADLDPRQRPVRVAYDEIGPVRAEPDSYVYFVGAENGLVKIGRSVNVERRLAGLRTHSPIPLELLAVKPGGHEQEWFYHMIFHKHRSHGEWFRPAKEIQSEIDAINGNMKGNGN